MWNECLPTVFGVCALLMATVCAQDNIVLENDFVRFTIAPDGNCAGFVDKATGRDYRADGPRAMFRMTRGDKEHPPSSCSFANDRIRVEFKEIGASAVVKVTNKKRWFTFEVDSVNGDALQSFVFSNLCLKDMPKVGSIADVVCGDEFGACILACNLQTNAGYRGALWAACYDRFGMAGAKIALIGCPADKMRDVMKEVLQAEGMVRSTQGGPWALDAPMAKGSYLFSKPTEADADEWIATAKRCGMDQMMLCGISSYGHYIPHAKLFPNGVAGVKAVVKKIHDAGMKAGMHMHTHAIGKTDPWVTPVPDRRLASDAKFTLAASVDAKASAIPTTDPVKDLPIEPSYWERSGNCIRIDDELITYRAISADAPCGFTTCQRGAYGTKAAPHEKGAEIVHLVERFAMFCPDGDSTLMDEMTQRIADFYSECDFDIIYFDGLDGADSFCGREWAWHYGPKFALMVFEKIKRKPFVEASSNPHHCWRIRSRNGAWDHPTRAPKTFLDTHCASGKSYEADFFPWQLGWWAIKSYSLPGAYATTPDVIEYLGCKCLGNSVALSLQFGDLAGLRKNARWGELLDIMGRYERLRLEGTVPESVRARLREPGKEFTLVKAADGKPTFVPTDYASHTIARIDGESNIWTSQNPFADQPLRLRIRALPSAAPYDAEGNMVLTDFSNIEKFKLAANRGVTNKIEKSTEQVKVAGVSARYTATNNTDTPLGAWARATITFDPWLDIRKCKALGVWVHGDGKGELLNFQLTDERGVGRRAEEHYVDVNFKGWRYFELIEPDAKRYNDYKWPYYGWYSIYRNPLNYHRVAELSIYYNNIPPKETVTCFISPIKAIGVETVKLKDPTVEVNGAALTFPAEIEGESLIEMSSATDCKLLDKDNNLLAEIKPSGGIPTVKAGANAIKFTCQGAPDRNLRATVTIITNGEALRE